MVILLFSGVLVSGVCVCVCVCVCVQLCPLCNPVGDDTLEFMVPSLPPAS